ncbi:MAG: hypothetical protein FRX48_05004 [Lasallia pustulata]|uniref:Winged helix-turn-helix DNA-binding domain n=1 Tax=Lasallia pustulata TaxID=136370 RepID=A0A1W5DBB0_9LECA|nr:MAG: hypothetical protein FRX48_05004 [Lasallia pustulata]SLM40376.1 Winged helix-turn-helix DNA-binding domain [Lasallia pustulata]
MASDSLSHSYAQSISSLLQQIQLTSANLASRDEIANDNARVQALEAAKKLVATLEKPEEVVMRYAFELGSHRMALRLGIDLGLFHILVEQNGKPVSAAELAERSRAELLLIVRIMRVISAIGFAAEAHEQSYVSTPLTKAITIPSLEAAVKVCNDLGSRIQIELHDYFRGHGYACPTDNSNCAFQWTFKTEAGYFEYVHSNPEKLSAFNTFMSGNRSTRKHWIDWFPVESEVLSGFSGGVDDVLIVDVGGGKGHDLERFLEKHPQANGHLVLQDLPKTISSIGESKEGIRIMSHNFFSAQPLKGARVYYTHFVFHDWPDDKCRDILRNLMTAMEPGYSKILLNESVLPNRDCPSFFAAGDINMMSILAGIARTRRQWVELVESVGLEVVKIWTSPHSGDVEGVIEAMLKT